MSAGPQPPDRRTAVCGARWRVHGGWGLLRSRQQYVLEAITREDRTASPRWTPSAVAARSVSAGDPTEEEEQHHEEGFGSLTGPRRAVCAARRSGRHPGEIPRGNR